MANPIQQLRAFDVVRYEYHGATSIGIVTEVSRDNCCHVDWFVNDTGMHNAWIPADKIEIIGNAMNAVARAMAHPMGNGRGYPDRSFPIVVDGVEKPYRGLADRE